MGYLITILLLILFGWYFIKLDLTVSFGPIISSGIAKRKFIYRILSILILISILFTIVLIYNSKNEVINITHKNLIIISLSSFIALFSFSRISKFISTPYAFIGALIGWKLASNIDVNIISNIKMVIVWIVAPFITIILSIIIYSIFRCIYKKYNLQLLSFAYYMHIIVIVGSLLLAIAVGINNESIVNIIGVNYMDDHSILINILIILTIFSILFIILKKRFLLDSDKFYLKYYNLSISELATIVLSSSIILFTLSFIRISNLNITIIPISLSSIFIGSLIGIGLAQKREKLEKDVLIKMIISNFICPLFAFILSYYSTSILNVQVNSYTLDFNILFISILAIILLLFLMYVIKQHQIKKIFKINAYTNQQEIFENQKILSKNEVEKVLDENRKLQNQLEHRRQALIDVALKISEQKTFLKNLYDSINTLSLESNLDKKSKIISELKTQIQQRIALREEIDGFYCQIESLHKDFDIRLSEKFPKITSQERKLTILLRLGFSSKYIASLMNISPKSVEISRYRLRIKLGLKKGDNLIKFIKTI